MLKIVITNVLEYKPSLNLKNLNVYALLYSKEGKVPTILPL